MSYHAIPLADRGFVPTDPAHSPVRWYVEQEGRPRLYGPFENMVAADEFAAEMNRMEVRHEDR